ncbi:hypothetical protein MD484_g8920, partial [Candolleomyces efflorescens]
MSNSITKYYNTLTAYSPAEKKLAHENLNKIKTPQGWIFYNTQFGRLLPCGSKEPIIKYYADKYNNYQANIQKIKENDKAIKELS